MDNHVHLLINESEQDVGSIMKRIGVGYVSWYNRKYNRRGHLFQDRFKSEVVETDEYVLSVLRYIHQNPLKAGLVNKVEDFRGSSYVEYIGSYNIIDGDFILGLFSEQKETAVKAFKKFMAEKADEIGYLEAHEKSMLSDEDVKGIIQQAANVKTPAALQAMKKEERDGYLREIKLVGGTSTRKIARLTGISQSVISRA